MNHYRRYCPLYARSSKLQHHNIFLYLSWWFLLQMGYLLWVPSFLLIWAIFFHVMQKRLIGTLLVVTRDPSNVLIIQTSFCLQSNHFFPAYILSDIWSLGGQDDQYKDLLAMTKQRHCLTSFSLTKRIVWELCKMQQDLDNQPIGYSGLFSTQL